ncbi:MAG TPA: hypothetical protein PLV88_01125 [Methanoregulaceae archaeon]|nr:hypothetical protein [Methanoregulaceae archaeon]HNI41416.1 hypothetical protein [Methanoregulaceae archaeon]HNO08868.1 hypothetical protein [Methanoregulaceae archaeon]HNW80716.1 hypothetical protein [Methanoregulaceae archaeon]
MVLPEPIADRAMVGIKLSHDRHADKSTTTVTCCEDAVVEKG